MAEEHRNENKPPETGPVAWEDLDDEELRKAAYALIDQAEPNSGAAALIDAIIREEEDPRTP